MPRILSNYIGGRFQEAAAERLIPLVNPATEEIVGEVPESSAEDVDAAVTAACQAFASWGAAPPKVRQSALNALADAMEANADALVEAQFRNTGQLKAMIKTEEVLTGADHL
ncbi:MAG: aldehyde dehydrogenase family protein, partial [Propionibacteriaceae bacterium]|nr:aldehyde dehydrogenase family protein [Propionibacteriaceae bacterium]